MKIKVLLKIKFQFDTIKNILDYRAKNIIEVQLQKL